MLKVKQRETSLEIYKVKKKIRLSLLEVIFNDCSGSCAYGCPLESAFKFLY